MLRSKHLVGLILAATLMATLIPFSAMVYAQTKEETKGFIKAAERAKDKADELMETMETEEIPDAIMKRYDEGLGNLTAAKAELENEDPDIDSAVELAKKAMEAFRDVYEELYTLLEDAGVTTASDDDEKLKGLLQAMDRALVRIGKIRDIVPPETVAANVTKILDSAETYLDLETAELWLAEGRVRETAWNLTQANKLIGLAHSLLKKGGQELKVKRMEHYIDILEKFCDRLHQLAVKAEAGDLVSELEYVNQTFIIVAKAALDKKPPDIQQAMDNLIEARNQLEQIKRDLLELRRGKPPAPSETWHVLADLEDESSFNDVEAYVTKIDKRKSVEFKVEIVSENVPHGVYGMGIAVSTSIDTIDFQVWYREYATPYGWYYQEYPWDTSPVVALGDSGTGITATGDHTGKVFTVDIPIELLGGREATYYFAIQFRTNLRGTYPEDLDLWAQTDASKFAEATV